MKKKNPDTLEKWTKKVKCAPFYYVRRKAANGEIIFTARYKTRGGRSKAIKRILAKELLYVHAA